ncbi:MAG: late competence development ComFB family protein [Firmicutes bacterium]|nr:late competence development ComFB family protein [Bacillota bacterium]
MDNQSFKNYMEDVVIEVYNDFKKSYPEYCSCPRCSADTLVLALSKLKGRYAVSPEGEIFAKLSREDRQVRADALVMIIEAAQLVAKQPNHER